MDRLKENIALRTKALEDKEKILTTRIRIWKRE
jgi:hypothetical protein